MKTRKAFSLIELSIVLMIIGILMIGAIKSSAIINSMRFSTAKNLTDASTIRNYDNLVAWYETTSSSSFTTGQVDDIYTDNTQISNWYDISPESLKQDRKILNNQDKSQKLTTSSPSANVTYEKSGIGKIPSIKFSGSGKLSYLSSGFRPVPPSASPRTLSNSTIFIVFKPTSTSGNVLMDSKTSVTTTFSISNNSATLNFGSSKSFVTNFIQNEYIVAIYANGNGASAIYKNSTSSPIIQNNIGNNQIQGLTIGNTKSGSSNGFQGLISEIIIFDGLLKMQERKEIFNYLSKKYKISVEGIV